MPRRRATPISKRRRLRRSHSTSTGRRRPRRSRSDRCRTGVSATPGGDVFIHPYLWTPGSPNATSGAWTDLGILPSMSSGAIGAFGINDSGEVVGIAATGANHAFLWKPDVANGTTGTTGTITVL